MCTLCDVLREHVEERRRPLVIFVHENEVTAVLSACYLKMILHNSFDGSPRRIGGRERDGVIVVSYLAAVKRKRLAVYERLLPEVVRLRRVSPVKETIELIAFERHAFQHNACCVFIPVLGICVKILAY